MENQTDKAHAEETASMLQVQCHSCVQLTTRFSYGKFI